MEKPWQRSAKEFTHPKLEHWVRTNRGDLIWAGLTAISAWFAADAPRSNKTLGSFEEWAALTGGLLEFLQIPDFLSNLDDLYAESDQVGRAWAEFIEYWRRDPRFIKGENMTTQELLPYALKAELPVRGKDQQSQVISLGRQLQNMRGRVIGEFVIEQIPGRHTEWNLVSRTQPRSAAAASQNAGGDGHGAADEKFEVVEEGDQGEF